MARRSVAVLLMLCVVAAFSIACGGGGGTADVTPTPGSSATPTPTPTQTPAPGASFAITEPSGPTTVIIGSKYRIRWTATGYSEALVIRIALDGDMDPEHVMTWFPMTYGNGSNYFDWNTTGYDVGTYYLLFDILDGSSHETKYSPAIVLTTEQPYLVPPTVQLISPLNSKTIFPDDEVAVRFKIGNTGADAVTVVGVDDDEIYGNGVTAWLSGNWVGPGVFETTWEPAGFPNGTYYLVVKASYNGLDTYAYSRPITVADFIDLGEPPQVEFQEPTDPVLVTTGQTVSVRFSLTDPDSAATATFILDNDSDPDNGWVERIYADVTEGVRSYDWNTLGVSPGVYYFLVAASDGLNETLKYSPAVIVNPVSGLTQPPTVTITRPTRGIIAPVGTPLQVEGTVTDPDSEAIVRIGVDNDNNYQNGITGWIDSAFTGSFSTNWITSYYPAGIYYIIVLADDGINQVYEYTQPIELKYLMPSGWITNRLAKVNLPDMFDGLDSLGAYHALHAPETSVPGIYHSTNSDGTWNTEQATALGWASPILGKFDSEDDVHYMFNYGYTNKTVYAARLGDFQLFPVTPAATDALPLDMIPDPAGEDVCLAAGINGSNVRVYCADISGGEVTRESVFSTSEAVNAANMLYGRIYQGADGKRHVILRVQEMDVSTGQPVKHTLIYYISGVPENWQQPVEMLDVFQAELVPVQTYFDGTTLHVMAQKKHQIVYMTVDCATGAVTTEEVIPVPEDLTEPNLDVSYAEMRMIEGAPVILWRAGEDLYEAKPAAEGGWDSDRIGSVKGDAAIFWLVTPTGSYVFTTTATNFGAFRSTALGWAFEPINTAEGFFPWAAYTADGDVLVAYRTTAGGENRLNFDRRIHTTEQWVNTKLGNDCSAFGPIRIYVNSANNIYIRYFDTNQYLTVVTFR